MNSSIISMIYLVALVLFFILLVIMTIAIIISSSKKNTDDKEEKGSNKSKNISDSKDASKRKKAKAAKVEFDNEDDNIFAEAESEVSASMKANDEFVDSAFADSAFTENAFDDADIDNFVDAITEELKTEVEETDEDDTVETVTDKVEDAETEIEEETEIPEAADVPETTVISQETEIQDEQDDELVDSAFAPEPVETGLTNEELTASVREAEAMGAAVIGEMSATGVSVDTIFGLNEELARYGTKRKNHKKSNVSSDEDFYWYNRMDVAEKPSYKTAEMYYHYFNLPKECIEDLLVEMYDCALVRTEEIKYLAYGIAPRAVSMKEILSYGNSNYVQHEKQKEPSTQDFVRIYEKWCGYVDRLFDKVEVHADDFTIDEIRKLLYEYGRSDVDVLIEGK